MMSFKTKILLCHIIIEHLRNTKLDVYKSGNVIYKMYLNEYDLYDFTTGFEVREVLDGLELEWKRPDEVYETAAAEDDGTGPYKDMADNGMLRVDGQPIAAGSAVKRLPDRVRSKTVHFILPLFNRLATFDRFMDNYESVCLANEERVTLTVVPFGRATVDRAVAAAAGLIAKYPGARIVVLPDLGESFARALALHAGADRVGPPPDDLLLFIDVDMLWTSALIERVRLNTVRGRSAYFPIVYSEYDPVVVYGRPTSPNHFLVNQDTGYWRQFGFGIVSVYKSDLTATGGFNTTIRGWGNEDVDLFDKFVRTRPATVFRAADPDLVHVYHPVECDPKLPEPKARMCTNTRFETYGNVDQFANIIYKNREKLYTFAGEQINNSIIAAAAVPPI